jgi:hypothetical protein
MRLGILLALISTFVFITVIGGPASATVSRPGYWLEAGDGGVFAYGAPFEASAAWDATRCPADPPARSMPDESCWSMASTSDVDGYWILNSYSGVIYTYGDAVSYGQPGDTPPYLGGADTWPDAIGIVAAPSGSADSAPSRDLPTLSTTATRRPAPTGWGTSAGRSPWQHIRRQGVLDRRFRRWSLQLR